MPRLLRLPALGPSLSLWALYLCCELCAPANAVPRYSRAGSGGSSAAFTLGSHFANFSLTGL